MCVCVYVCIVNTHIHTPSHTHMYIVPADGAPVPHNGGTKESKGIQREGPRTWEGEERGERTGVGAR